MVRQAVVISLFKWTTRYALGDSVNLAIPFLFTHSPFQIDNSSTKIILNYSYILVTPPLKIKENYELQEPHGITDPVHLN